MEVSASPPISITFYTKPGCHLCEDVAAELEALAAHWPLNVAAIDITADLDLNRQYWDKIPVVVVGSQRLAAPIAPEDLQAAVRRAAEQS